MLWIKSHLSVNTLTSLIKNNICVMETSASWLQKQSTPGCPILQHSQGHLYLCNNLVSILPLIIHFLLNLVHVKTKNNWAG